MLLLSRHVDERLFLTTEAGEEICVTIAGIRGNQVKIAVDAPATVRIEREEVRAARLRGDGMRPGWKKLTG